MAFSNVRSVVVGFAGERIKLEGTNLTWVFDGSLAVYDNNLETDEELMLGEFHSWDHITVVDQDTD